MFNNLTSLLQKYIYNFFYITFEKSTKPKQPMNEKCLWDICWKQDGVGNSLKKLPLQLLHTFYNDIVSSRFHWNQASSLLFSCTSCTTCDKLTATKAIPAVNVTLTHTISFWEIAHCITANLVNTKPAHENKHY